jgi:hypothetical protein
VYSTKLPDNLRVQQYIRLASIRHLLWYTTCQHENSVHMYELHQLSFTDPNLFSTCSSAATCRSRFFTSSTHLCLLVLFSHSNSTRPCAVLRPKQHLSSVKCFPASTHVGSSLYTPKTTLLFFFDSAPPMCLLFNFNMTCYYLAMLLVIAQFCLLGFQHLLVCNEIFLPVTSC